MGINRLHFKLSNSGVMSSCFDLHLRVSPVLFGLALLAIWGSTPLAEPSPTQRSANAKRDCGAFAEIDLLGDRRSIHHLTAAQTIRDASAVLELAQLVRNHSGKPRLVEPVLDLLQRVDATENPDTQCQLGALLADFDDADLLIEGAQWFRRSALRGHPYAQFHLGVMFASGEGVKRNLAEAKIWLELATHGALDAITLTAASAVLDYLNLPTATSAPDAKPNLTVAPSEQKKVEVFTDEPLPLASATRATPVRFIPRPPSKGNWRQTPMRQWVRPMPPPRPRYAPVPPVRSRP
jgi:hypothetical protein